MFGFVPLFRRYPATLAFGVLLTTSSSFGQTFFVALFGAGIRDRFDITHGTFGAIFAGATLTAAVLLPYSGRLLDRLSLRRYYLIAGLGMAAACLIMGTAQTLPALALAVLMLRLFGQGIFTNTAMTSVARHIPTGRGKALGVTALGHPLGEAVLPTIAIAAVALLGDWQTVWIVLSVIIAAGLLPLGQGLIWCANRPVAGGHDERSEWPKSVERRHWALGEVLRDPVFWLFVPAVMMPSFVGTGFVFHQAHLVEVNGWSIAWYASMFTLYAATRALGTILVGPLIDRTGSVPVTVWMPAIQAIGVLALAASGAHWAGAVFLAASGLSAAAGGVLIASLLTELYGVRHLGAIRSFVMSLMIASTALSPPIFGWLIDAGISLAAVAAVCALGAIPVMGAAAMAAAILRKRDGAQA